jgi:hypothetical protein
VAQEPLIAVFVDFENLAIGARQMRKGNFKVDLVLRRLLEKGRIVYKRAYCDWGKYRNAVREFHGHGVDALDLCYQKGHIDSFALLSGDSDFSPLVAKLKENDKRVIGCGIKSSTSDLLISGCDEFIYYDDLIRQSERSGKGDRRPAKAGGEPGEAATKVVEIVRSLERDYDTVWGSMVKQATKRVFPGFNEEYFGFSSFADMLEKLRAEGHIDLEFDEKRGNYIVRSHRD